jgi:universal stress protein A
MKKLSIQNIVVPIDFSEMSIDAIKIACRLARSFTASIHLAHVRHFDYLADFVAPVPPMAPFSFMPYAQDRERSALAELNGLAREYGVPSATCHVLGGAPPFDEICRVAQEIPADLIVMPTHGRTGLKHVFLGSTAERIVQHSSCPVLVTRGNALPSKNGSRLKIKAILVPVDFSSCSREGLRYAIGFANEFGARIILLHATYLGYIYSSEGTAIYDIPALQKAARKTAQRKMRELVRSKAHKADVIITSTHGLTGFKHVLIGSIAEQVVRHAPCSVLVVPSHPQIRAANLAKSGRAKAGTLTNSPPRIRPAADQQQSQKSQNSEALTRKNGKLTAHAFPERRKTNKFRESHLNR